MVEVVGVDNLFELCVETLIQLTSTMLLMHVVNFLCFTFNCAGSGIACNLLPICLRGLRDRRLEDSEL